MSISKVTCPGNDRQHHRNHRSNPLLSCSRSDYGRETYRENCNCRLISGQPGNGNGVNSTSQSFNVMNSYYGAPLQEVKLEHLKSLGLPCSSTLNLKYNPRGTTKSQRRTVVTSPSVSPLTAAAGTAGTGTGGEDEAVVDSLHLQMGSSLDVDDEGDDGHYHSCSGGGGDKELNHSQNSPLFASNSFSPLGARSSSSRFPGSATRSASSNRMTPQKPIAARAGLGSSTKRPGSPPRDGSPNSWGNNSRSGSPGSRPGSPSAALPPKSPLQKELSRKPVRGHSFVSDYMTIVDAETGENYIMREPWTKPKSPLIHHLSAAQMIHHFAHSGGPEDNHHE